MAVSIFLSCIQKVKQFRTELRAVFCRGRDNDVVEHNNTSTTRCSRESGNNRERGKQIPSIAEQEL